MAPAPAWQSNSSIESALASNLTPISQESAAFLLQGKRFIAVAALPVESGTSFHLCSKEEVQMATFLFFSVSIPCQIHVSSSPTHPCCVNHASSHLHPPLLLPLLSETHGGHASVWLLFPMTPPKLRATPEPRELIFHLRN